MSLKYVKIIWLRSKNFSVNPAIPKKVMKNFLPKALIKKNKTESILSCWRNIQVQKYSQIDGYCMVLGALERKISWLWWRHSNTFSQDFVNNIKVYCAGITIFKFKSPCRENEPVNKELFKRHFNEVSQVSLF